MIASLKISFPLARVLLTLVLVVFVYLQLDVLTLVNQILKLGIEDFLFFCGLYAVGQFMSAYKWRMLLGGVGILPAFKSICEAYFLGMFVNTFGLGTVGGDVARTLAVPCPEGQRGMAAATVLADRIHGLTVLLIVGCSSLFFFAPESVPIEVRFLSGALAVCLVFGWFFAPLLCERLLPEGGLKDKLVKALRAFPRNGSLIVHVTALSVLFHVLQIYLAVCIFISLGADLSLEQGMASIPFINGASALPISVNGLGVREAASMYLLSPFGVAAEAAVAFSGIWLIVVTIVSAIGGMFLTVFANGIIRKYAKA